MRKYLIIVIVILCGCTRNMVVRQYSDYSTTSAFKNSDSVSYENLEILCRVWGFAKYHHPIFADSTVSIDYELFELLPQVAYATHEQCNEVLSKWIDGLGAYKYHKGKYDKLLLESECHSITDCEWIHDTPKLGRKLSDKLKRLRYADRKSNYYVRHHQIFSTPVFKHEASYPAYITTLDTGYRLLALFRYWNIIEYYFPYKLIADNDWDEVLRKYMPLFLKDTPYIETMAMLITETNDSHSFFDINAMLGERMLPVEVAFIENKLVVVSKNIYGSEILRPGDEIVMIDDQTIDEISNNIKKIVSTSSNITHYRDVANYGLLTRKMSVAVKYKRNSQLLNTEIQTIHIKDKMLKVKKYDMDKKTFTQLNDSIGYLYPAYFDEGYDLNSLQAKINTVKYLIIDHRCYPLLTSRIIDEFFIACPTHITSFTVPIIELPGYYKYEKEYAGNDNPNSYKGQIIMLVNEQTQSMAEYTTMMLQASNNAIVVGSQTAGADGNIELIPLIGKTNTCISTLGVFYPDETSTQRIGVKIDHWITPTIAGVKAERDEVLEEALKIINNEMTSRQ